MKTPEEIKNGLGDLNQKLLQGFVDRPPITPEEAVELVRIAESVANYQQVSKALCGKENATLEEVLQAVRQVKADASRKDDTIRNLTELLNAANDEAAKYKRERDALLEYLTEGVVMPCKICKHAPDDGAICCQRLRDLRGNCFEWRGCDVYPENTEVQANIRKAEDCRYYTQNSFWGAGCLGTKEIDPCKGDGCERWKPKEET